MESDNGSALLVVAEIVGFTLVRRDSWSLSASWVGFDVDEGSGVDASLSKELTRFLGRRLVAGGGAAGMLEGRLCCLFVFVAMILAGHE